MKKLIASFFDKKFLKFCIVGVVNTLFGSAVMFGLYNFLPWSDWGFADLGRWPYWISSGANYVLGSILSYFLNRAFTFEYKKRDFATVLRFALNIAVCYLVAYGAAKPLVRLILESAGEQLRGNAAMLAGMVIFVGLNYLGQRFFAFREPAEAKPAENEENGENKA